MRTYLLFKLEASAGVTIVTLNFTDLQKEFPKINQEDLRVDAELPTVLRYPIETWFVSTRDSETGVNGYSLIYDNHIHISSSKPLFRSDEIYLESGKPLMNPEADELGYLFKHIMSLEEFNGAKSEDKVRSLATAYNAHGYTIDVEKVITPPVPATIEEALAEGLMLHEAIKLKYPTPTIKTSGFHIDPETWNMMIRNILKGKNVLLLGGTGTGKTELVGIIAETMKRAMYTIDMGTIQDAQSAMIGVHRLNSDGKSMFDYAPFTEYIQQPQAIILLDEINR